MNFEQKYYRLKTITEIRMLYKEYLAEKRILDTHDKSLAIQKCKLLAQEDVDDYHSWIVTVHILDEVHGLSKQVLDCFDHNVRYEVRKRG